MEEWPNAGSAVDQFDKPEGKGHGRAPRDLSAGQLEIWFKSAGPEHCVISKTAQQNAKNHQISDPKSTILTKKSPNFSRSRARRNSALLASGNPPTQLTYRAERFPRRARGFAHATEKCEKSLNFAKKNPKSGKNSKILKFRIFRKFRSSVIPHTPGSPACVVRARSVAYYAQTSFRKIV